jgi:hypothetical protein
MKLEAPRVKPHNVVLIIAILIPRVDWRVFVVQMAPQSEPSLQADSSES